MEDNIALWKWQKNKMYSAVGGGGGAAKPALPSPNTDIVQISSIDAIQTSGAEIVAAASPGMNLLSLYRPERIRQTCSITNVSLYCGSAVPFTSAKLQIWRKDGTTYDKISESDLTALITTQNGINNITLSTPISAQEGDYVAWSFIGAARAVYAAVAAANSIRYTTAETPTDTNYAWESKTGIAYKFATHCKSGAPLMVGIGDSIMMSYPYHASMVDTTFTPFDITKTWLYKLKALNAAFTYQDAGVGNEETTAIEARFNRDVVLIKPKIVVINGGINDIGHDKTKVTFLAKWTAMLDACVTNSIIPIVWKIMPWTNGTTLQMQTRDEWNADLVTLFNTYDIDGKIIIDWDVDMGMNRVGGDAGNLWDIKTAYNNDGVHFTEAGQAKIAEVMLREIGKVFKL